MRTFKIINVKNSKKKQINISGGVYRSNQMIRAAQKMFSQISSEMVKQPKILYITLQETTRDSKKKIRIYKVSRINEQSEVNYNGKIIIHKYKTIATKMSKK